MGGKKHVMRTVSFKISEELLDLVNDVCKMRGMNRSELIRRAITEQLKKEMRQ